MLYDYWNDPDNWCEPDLEPEPATCVCGIEYWDETDDPYCSPLCALDAEETDAGAPWYMR